MEMPSAMQVITSLIALLSLVMAYLGFRDKKTDKTDKELADRIKATVLSDAVTVKAEALANSVNAKAQILSDAVNIKSIEIKELQQHTNDCETELKVMKEQISAIIRESDKMDKKLDKIIELVYMNYRDSDHNDN